MSAASSSPPPDPASDFPADPVARKKNPAYLMGPDAYFPKVRLIEQTPTRWGFVPEGNRDTLGWFQILFGGLLGAFIVMVIYSGWPSYHDLFGSILPLGFSISIMGRGLHRLKSNRTRVCFDLESKTCRLVVAGVRDANPDRRAGELLARIEDLRAVELLHVEDSLCCRSCFELNLVFLDQTRVFVIGSPLPDPIRDDATRLAAFLGKPLEKTSTQGGPHRWSLLPGRPPRG